MQLFESVNLLKLFPYVADIVLRGMCVAGVSALNIELHFRSDVVSVRFQNSFIFEVQFYMQYFDSDCERRGRIFVCM